MSTKPAAKSAPAAPAKAAPNKVAPTKAAAPAANAAPVKAAAAPAAAPKVAPKVKNTPAPAAPKASSGGTGIYVRDLEMMKHHSYAELRHEFARYGNVVCMRIKRSARKGPYVLCWYADNAGATAAKQAFPRAEFIHSAKAVPKRSERATAIQISPVQFPSRRSDAFKTRSGAFKKHFPASAKVRLLRGSRTFHDRAIIYFKSVEEARTAVLEINKLGDKGLEAAGHKGQVKASASMRSKERDTKRFVTPLLAKRRETAAAKAAKEAEAAAKAAKKEENKRAKAARAEKADKARAAAAAKASAKAADKEKGVASATKTAASDKAASPKAATKPAEKAATAKPAEKAVAKPADKTVAKPAEKVVAKTEVKAAPAAPASPKKAESPKTAPAKVEQKPAAAPQKTEAKPSTTAAPKKTDAKPEVKADAKPAAKPAVKAAAPKKQ